MECTPVNALGEQYCHPVEPMSKHDATNNCQLSVNKTSVPIVLPNIVAIPHDKLMREVSNDGSPVENIQFADIVDPHTTLLRYIRFI
jgi:hypothetical protein